MQSANYVKANLINPVTNEPFPSSLTTKIFVTPDIEETGGVNLGRYVDTCIVTDKLCVDSDGNVLLPSACTTKCLN